MDALVTLCGLLKTLQPVGQPGMGPEVLDIARLDTLCFFRMDQRLFRLFLHR